MTSDASIGLVIASAAPVSLKRRYPLIGQPPLSEGGFQPRSREVFVPLTLARGPA